MEQEMKPAEVKLPQPNISGIKNKQRRGEAFRQLKREKTKVKLCNRVLRSCLGMRGIPVGDNMVFNMEFSSLCAF